MVRGRVKTEGILGQENSVCKASEVGPSSCIQYDWRCRAAKARGGRASW